MSSNEKETGSIQPGDDNSVKQEGHGANAPNLEKTETGTANEQAATAQNAQLANDSAKPEKTEKKSGFWFFGRKAKAAPVEQAGEEAAQAQTTAEQSQITAEQTQTAAEQSRPEAEQTAEKPETVEAQEKASPPQADIEQPCAQETEQAKTKAEEAKTRAEQARLEAEQAQARAEQARLEAEQAKARAEQARLEAEKHDTTGNARHAPEAEETRQASPQRFVAEPQAPEQEEHAAERPRVDKEQQRITEPQRQETGQQQESAHDYSTRQHEAEDRHAANYRDDVEEAPMKESPSREDWESGAAPRATEIRPGLCGRIFNGLAHIAPLALVCLLACMVWPDYWQAMRGEALYCPPEANGITTFLNSIAQRNMLEPHGISSGALVAQWPGFIWFAALLAMIPVGADLLWPMVASIGAALALVATWSLAHASRFGSKAAFAAGLILLCAPIFAPLGHFVGKSALTAALALFALTFFARGWLSEKAWLSLPLAFIFTALAGLTGGIYGLALPLVASFCFLLWRGNLGRSSKSDAILGFGLLLAIVGAWLGLLILKGTDPNYINALFANSWQNPWPLPADWWLAGLVALIGLVPWIALVICVSWIRVMKTSIRTLSASRKDNGSALVWISAVLAWLLTFVIPGSTHIAVITLACLFAVLLGKAFINLPPFGNRLFFLICAIALIIVGLVVLACGFEFSQPWILGLLPIALPNELPHLLLTTNWAWIIGAICLVGGLIMFKYFKSYHLGGGLVFCALVSIALAQPAVLMVAPDLGAKNFSQLKNLQTIEKNLTEALKTPEKAEEPQSPNAPAETQTKPEAEPTAAGQGSGGEPASAQDSGAAPAGENKAAPADSANQESGAAATSAGEEKAGANAGAPKEPASEAAPAGANDNAVPEAVRVDPKENAANETNAGAALEAAPEAKAEHAAEAQPAEKPGQPAAKPDSGAN